MGKKSSQVDDYIAAAEKFAQPILKRVRRLHHNASPQFEESIKWLADCKARN